MFSCNAGESRRSHRIKSTAASYVYKRQAWLNGPGYTPAGANAITTWAVQCYVLALYQAQGPVALNARTVRGPVACWIRSWFAQLAAARATCRRAAECVDARRLPEWHQAVVAGSISFFVAWGAQRHRSAAGIAGRSLPFLFGAWEAYS